MKFRLWCGRERILSWIIFQRILRFSGGMRWKASKIANKVYSEIVQRKVHLQLLRWLLDGTMNDCKSCYSNECKCWRSQQCDLDWNDKKRLSLALFKRIFLYFTIQCIFSLINSEQRSGINFKSAPTRVTIFLFKFFPHYPHMNRPTWCTHTLCNVFHHFSSTSTLIIFNFPQICSKVAMRRALQQETIVCEAIMQIAKWNQLL